MPSSFARSFLPYLLLALVAYAAFAPGLGGRFLFDDYANIVSNPRVHMETIDATSLRKAAVAFEPGPVGRPLATLTFAFDHYRGGRDPAPYKLTSLLVHVANSLLVFLLASRLFALAWPGRAPTVAAFAVALAWAVHPLQVSTVLYIVQRMESLSATFVILGLLAYMHGRRAQAKGERGWPWLAGSVALAGIGTLAKESALLFPAYTLALELTLLGFAARSDGTAALLRKGYAVAVVLGLALYVLVVLPYTADPAHYLSREFTAGERVLTQMRVLPMNLGWIVLPLADHMVFYYDQLEPSHGWLDPWTTTAGAALLVALLGLAVALRQRAPLVALGIFWFFGAHFITSSPVPLELAFEHRNYFAMLGPLLAIGDIVRRIAANGFAGPARMAISAVLGMLMLLCLLRAATWGDPFLLAADMSQRNPHSARAANDMGEQLMLLADGDGTSPYYSLAQLEFARGAALPNSSILSEQALILMAATHGQPVDPRWWDAMERKLRTRPVEPQTYAGVVGLLRQRNKGVELDDRQLARIYTTLAERMTVAPSHLAVFADHALVQAHDPDLADRLFAMAVEGSDPDYMVQLARVLIVDGHERQARVVIEAAARRGVVIR